MNIMNEAATTLDTVAAIAATAAGINKLARRNSLRNRVFWIGIAVGVGVGLVVGTALTASLGDATVATARKLLRSLRNRQQDEFNREFLV